MQAGFYALPKLIDVPRRHDLHGIPEPLVLIKISPVGDVL
jgi:hypothetical protein